MTEAQNFELNFGVNDTLECNAVFAYRVNVAPNVAIITWSHNIYPSIYFRMCGGVHRQEDRRLTLCI